MAGSVRWYAGSATGRGDRRAVGVAPAGATRHESRRYALGAGLASRLYYINFIFEQNPAVLEEWARDAGRPARCFLSGNSRVDWRLYVETNAVIGIGVGWLRNRRHGQAQQFIYKWNDEQGQIKYSNCRRRPACPYETVRKPAGFGKERRSGPRSG